MSEQFLKKLLRFWKYPIPCIALGGRKPFRAYFSVKKENLIGQKEPFFSVLSIWKNQNKYYTIFGRKNSWKNVVSLTIAQNPISEILLIFTNFSFVMEMNCWNINVDMITFDSPSNTEYIYKDLLSALLNWLKLVLGQFR